MGNEKNRVIVLVGKSAAGKDSIAKILSDKYPDLHRPVATTSRPKRIGEIEGEDYYFITKSLFKEKIKKGCFWEYASYHAYKQDKIEEWFYGLDRANVDLFNTNYIIPADLPRLRQLKRRLGKRVIAVYIDVEVNQRRYRATARDKKFNILEWERRVSDENYVFQNIESEVNYVVSNQILEECVKQIENIYKWHA